MAAGNLQTEPLGPVFFFAYPLPLPFPAIRTPRASPACAGDPEGVRADHPFHFCHLRADHRFFFIPVKILVARCTRVC